MTQFGKCAKEVDGKDDFVLFINPAPWNKIYKLEKVKDERHVYDVVFDSIEKVSSVKGGTYEPVSEASIVKEGKEINKTFIN